MSEQDNTPEHGEDAVNSPAPEPAPEPAAESAPHAAEPAPHAAVEDAPEEGVVAEEVMAQEVVADPGPAHEVLAEPEPVAEPVAETAHDAVVEPGPEAVDAGVPASDSAPAGVFDGLVPESANAPPAVDEAPEAVIVEAEEAVAVAEADPMPEPVVASEVQDAAAAEPVGEAAVAATEVVETVAVEPEVAPISEPVEPEVGSAVDPALLAAGAAAAGAVAGAAASAAARPIWSDQGDAPFDDGEAERPGRQGRPEKAKRESGGFFAELFDIVRTVVYALLIAMVVRIFFFQPFTIPSASMEPNLYEGDYIIVSKWSYGYSRHSMPWSPPLFEGRILSRMAERGDIVVFKRANNDGQGYTDYIKRIIGLPGDTVQMIANRLYINGEVVPDVVVEAAQVRGAFQGQTPIQLRETLPGGHAFRIQDFGPGSPSDDTDAFTIPDGHYFVMGDNRDDSMDSRYVWEAGGVGLVPHENLVGKAQVILFSWTPGASLGNPVSWFSHARTERFFTDLE